MSRDNTSLTSRERWMILLIIGGVFTACGLWVDWLGRFFGQ